MLVINEGWANTSGEKRAGKETSAFCAVLSPKGGDELFSTPQGLQGVCSAALPMGLSIFQQPGSDWLLVVHCCGTRPLPWMG